MCLKLTILKYIIWWLTIVLFMPSNSFGQDTLWLLDGNRVIMPEFTIDSINYLVNYKNQRGRSKRIFLDNVFCIKKEAGEEILFYQPTKKEISITNRRNYIHGMFDADQKHKVCWELFLQLLLSHTD